MITTLLIPALVLSLGGDHAVYHPKDCNLYFEVPNVSGALEAYKEAPLVRLFEDPEIKKFVGLVTSTPPEQVSLHNLSQILLSELRNELPVAGVGFLDLVPEVDHASFSLAGIDLNGLLPLIQEANHGDSEGMLQRLGDIGITLVVDFNESDTAAVAEELIRSQLLEHALNASPSAPSLIDASREPGTELDLGDYDLKDDDHPVFVSVVRSTQRLTVTLGLSPAISMPLTETNTLASNKRFQSTGAHWMGSEGTTILNTYFSITGVGELIELFDLIPGCPPGLIDGANFFLDTTMAGGELHIRMRTRLAAGQFHSETFTLQPGLDPAHQLFSLEPITRQSFRMAPPDAVGVSAFNLNKNFLAGALMKGLVTVTGREEQILLADLKEGYDFHPVEDLVGSLGGSAMTYTLPYTAIGQPKVFLALDLENPKAFAAGLESLGQFALDEGKGMIGVQSKPYRKNPLVVFSPGKALMQQLYQGIGEAAPAFIEMNLVIGVLDDRAIVSTSSMFTKRELKRLMKSNGSERHPLMDDARDLPTGIQSYTTTDWGSMIEGGYESVRGFLPLIVNAAGVELPFELEDMPSGELFSMYFQPSVLWSRQVDGGAYAHGTSSFGPELPFLIGAGAGAGVVIGTRKEKQSNAWPPAEEKPKLPDSDELMKELRVALELYQAEHGTFPTTLAELAVPSKNFPEGFIRGGVVPRGMTYSLEVGGNGYELSVTVSSGD